MNLTQNAKLYGYDKGHDTANGGVGSGSKALSSTQWQLIIMIFYVGLVLFQVPGCIGYRVFPASKVSQNPLDLSGSWDASTWLSLR